MSDTKATDLVQQGLTAARVGDVEDARQLLTEATEQTPNNIEAWLGLAGVVDSLEEKRRCFKKVLALDPDHQEAQAGLALVEKKLGVDRTANDAETGDEADTGVTVCYRHPQIETGLRCNRCNKPICPKCAHRTPVGFRCPECVREQEDKYYSGGTSDYVIAAVVAFPLTLITAGLFTFFLGRLGLLLLFIGFFIVPVIAGFIAEVVRWAVKKRRSRYLGRIVAACFVLGTLPYLFLGIFVTGGIFAPGLFLFLGTGTILARLR